MTCRDFDTRWLRRQEGRPGPEQAEWDRHLVSCPACAERARHFEELEVELEALSDVPAEPPPYLAGRVLARLTDERRGRRPWQVFRWVTASRLLVATTACLAFFAGLLVRELGRFNDWAGGRGVEHSVVLEYQAATADEVRLVGDFNGWGRAEGPVRTERRDGHWVFRVELAPGRYQYAFLVDGKTWLPDPGAPSIIPDGFGGANSVLYVTTPGADRGQSL